MATCDKHSAPLTLQLQKSFCGTLITCHSQRKRQAMGGSPLLSRIASNIIVISCHKNYRIHHATEFDSQKVIASLLFYARRFNSLAVLLETIQRPAKRPLLKKLSASKTRISSHWLDCTSLEEWGRNLVVAPREAEVESKYPVYTLDL